MGWNDAFNHFPHLETEKYVLRRLKVTDAKSLYNYFSKDAVTKYYDLEPFQAPQQAVELIESLLFRYEAKQQIRWGITLKNQGDIIGTCGLHAIEKEHAKAELGYDLHPNYWGKGVMTEVIARIVDFGFEEMKLNRIEALYNPINHASRRVLEKNGFKIEGILRKRFHKKGEYSDAAISAIIREDKKENL